jgi:RND family efflux transporter MFP subunit
MAEEALQRAQDGSDQYLRDPLTGAAPDRPELEQATVALEAAKAHHAKLLESSSPDVIARAYSDLASARAQLQRLEDGVAPAQIQAAEADVRQAETALYLSQLQVDKATVRAPVDGIVSQLSTTQGAMIVPGSPVLDLLSQEVQIVIHVEESRLPDLRIGQPAVISVDIFPNRTYIGEIAIIAPEIDPTTGTIRVTIRARDGAGELVPGMVAIVDLAQ